MKNTNYKHLYSVENTELKEAAEKYVCLFFQLDIATHFPMSKGKEVFALIEAHKKTINDIEGNLKQSKEDAIFFVQLLNNQSYSIGKTLKKYADLTAIIRRGIGLRFTQTHTERNILFNILLKWCFSANYETDTEDIIQEKLIWTKAFCETLEKVLYDKKIAISAYKQELRQILNLLRDHFDNLRTLLMSEEEIQKEIEIAERFGKKTDFSDFVLSGKR